MLCAASKWELPVRAGVLWSSQCSVNIVLGAAVLQEGGGQLPTLSCLPGSSKELRGLVQKLRGKCCSSALWAGGRSKRGEADRWKRAEAFQLRRL